MASKLIRVDRRRTPKLPLPKILNEQWTVYFEYIKSKYGISEVDWRTAYERQRGLCAICGKPRDRLITDHDHKTGQFRGLLCLWCNGLLGKFEKHGRIMAKYLALARYRANHPESRHENVQGD